MKIVQLTAENIKRLRAVEIRPDGNLVEITGRNGQGKTSVLDSIWWALGGTKSVQAEPIRQGEESGMITLDLGAYKVTRKFRRKADGEIVPSLTVENADGAKYGSPQEILSGFIGDLSFDPLAFSRMKARDQVVALRNLVPDFDFEAADKSNDEDFKARTDVNRQVRDLNAQIDAVTVPDDTPDARVSTEALMEELQAAMEKNSAAQAAARALDGKKNQLEINEEAIRRSKSAIARIEADLESEKQRLVDLEQGVEELRDEIDGIRVPEAVDIDPIRQRIAGSEQANRAVDLRERRQEMVNRRKAAEARSAVLTAAIDARKAEAAKAVREANLPVQGLELTEDAVLLNGVPFDQASDAEKLRVSIAVAGAMNPKLRVIRVRDGSLLDDEAMKALAAYADDNDLQVWIERVDSSGKVGIVIEDGMVAAPLAEAAE